jgi:apolipoprotein N-acyltransferase
MSTTLLQRPSITATAPKKVLRRNPLALYALAGAVLGLSAPGLDQWYLAWFGLVPLFAGTFLPKTKTQSVINSFLFGACYTLVHLHWVLTLRPFMAIGGPQNLIPTALFYWLLSGVHQATLFAVFAFIARSLFEIFGLCLKRSPAQWLALAVLALPCLWVLTFNKIGNSSQVLGIPWTMLEYSQYQQSYLIQIAGIVGGVGIGAFIVAANVVGFSTLSLFFQRRQNGFQPKGLRQPVVSGVATILAVLIVTYTFGAVTLSKADTSGAQSTFLSIVQANPEAKAKQQDVARTNLTLCMAGPAGLCLWPEWSLAVDLPSFPELTDHIKRITKEQHQDWLVGSTDRNAGHDYNVACAFTAEGQFLQPVYRKRKLVPFGEYRPWLLNEIARIISPRTPAYVGTFPGSDAAVYQLRKGTVAPLLCLEIAYPELTAEACRKGAELIVDLSNITWFDSPTVGKHLIACGVLRAIETSRYVAYATTTGPSAIIDPTGKILISLPPKRSVLVSREVAFRSKLTPFVQWFR